MYNKYYCHKLYINLILEFSIGNISYKIFGDTKRLKEQGKEMVPLVKFEGFCDGKLNFMKYVAFQCAHIGNRWNGKWFHITKANASLTIWSAFFVYTSHFTERRKSRIKRLIIILHATRNNMST